MSAFSWWQNPRCYSVKSKTTATFALNSTWSFSGGHHILFILPDTKHSSAKSSLFSRLQHNTYTGNYNNVQVLIFKFYIHVNVHTSESALASCKMSTKRQFKIIISYIVLYIIYFFDRERAVS